MIYAADKKDGRKKEIHRNMKKILAVLCSLAILIGGIAAFSACNSKTLVGFDIELAQAVADKIGVELECVKIDWETKEAELEAGKIDMAWNGFTYTKERDEGYTDENGNKIGGLDFSGKYMRNKQVAVVKKENAEKYNTLEKMKTAKNFVAEKGSAGYSTIQEIFGKEPVGAIRQVDTFTEINAGTSDIAVVDKTLAGSYIISETGAYYNILEVLDIDGVKEEFYAIGFREGSNLPKVFNNILAGLVKDGTFMKIAEKYGVEDIVVTDEFGTYDPNYEYPTDGDYKKIIDAGKMILAYTEFEPMAYFE